MIVFFSGLKSQNAVMFVAREGGHYEKSSCNFKNIQFNGYDRTI